MLSKCNWQIVFPIYNLFMIKRCNPVRQSMYCRNDMYKRASICQKWVGYQIQLGPKHCVDFEFEVRFVGVAHWHWEINLSPMFLSFPQWLCIDNHKKSKVNHTKTALSRRRVVSPGSKFGFPSLKFDCEFEYGFVSFGWWVNYEPLTRNSRHMHMPVAHDCR